MYDAQTSYVSDMCSCGGKQTYTPVCSLKAIYTWFKSYPYQTLVTGNDMHQAIQTHTQIPPHFFSTVPPILTLLSSRSLILVLIPPEPLQRPWLSEYPLISSSQSCLHSGIIVLFEIFLNDLVLFAQFTFFCFHHSHCHSFSCSQILLFI